MTRGGWVKIAHDIGGSEQAVDLPEAHYLAGVGLFVLAITWSDRQRTDGHIPRGAMSRAVAPGIECAAVIEALERVGLLKATTEGWDIPNYLEWQRSAAEIEAAIEQRRQAGKASAASRSTTRSTTRSTDQTRQDQTEKTPKTQGGGDHVERIRELSNGALSLVDVLGLVEQYGDDAVSNEAERLAADQRNGTKVISWPSLLEHRLKQQQPRPSVASVPKRPKCPRCSGSAYVFAPDDDEVAIKCPDCEGSGDA